MRLPTKSSHLPAAVVIVLVILIASFMGYQFATMGIDDQAVAAVKAEVIRLETNTTAAQTITLKSFEHCPG